MGQDDKGWSALVTLLADRKEEWWVTVMGVGLDPELSKVVRVLGSSYCPNWEGIQGTPLAGRSPSTAPVTSTYTTTTQCLLPLALSPALRTNMASVVLLFVSMVKPAIVPTPVGPLPLSCSTRRGIV